MSFAALCGLGATFFAFRRGAQPTTVSAARLT
jgi:hypothetical protein